MADETHITIVGNLTADPELRYTQNGIAVANMTIARTPRHWNRQTNEWEDGEPMFLRASVWREHAEHVAGSLTKGMRVIAYGALQARSYETQDGERRAALELKVEEIGPALRYATASVSRAQRQQSAPSASVAADQDAWATTQPGTGYDSETPF